ncbi:response regulator transcription factor [Larkinella soli]|uniref:response regulator transcription factor n=1 Tax=Larkinella soli TaxID=1770527 RepID=UPI0019D16BA0|nr:response regulator transcription factor [Larkinella soli]
MGITLALVDDQPHLLTSLKEKLAHFDEVEVILTARSGRELLALLPGRQPQVVLMDIEMDDIDGIKTTAEVVRLYPQIRVIMLTIFDHDEKVFEAICAGASGYLLKDERPSQLVNAIEDVVNNGAPMSSSIARRTLDIVKKLSVGQKPEPEELLKPRNFQLTNREIEILENLAAGLTHLQISEKLFISGQTVRKHIENIYQKLQVHTRAEALSIAYRNKWV